MVPVLLWCRSMFKMCLSYRFTKEIIYLNKQEYWLSKHTTSLDFKYKYNRCEHSSYTYRFLPNFNLERCCQFRNIPILLIEHVWSICDLCRRLLNPDLLENLSVMIKLLTRYDVLIKSQCLYITLFDMCIQIDKSKFNTLCFSQKNTLSRVVIVQMLKQTSQVLDKLWCTVFRVYVYIIYMRVLCVFVMFSYVVVVNMSYNCFF